MTPTEKIDAALDAVLVAQGIGISCHRQFPDVVNRMRDAMRKIMDDSYKAGEDAANDVRRVNAWTRICHDDAIYELARYFTSKNDVPVERATIPAKDFWHITGLTPNAAHEAMKGK